MDKGYRKDRVPVYSILLSGYLLLCGLMCVDANLDEKQLQEDIIKGYNRLVRPVEHNSDTLVVKFGIRLVSILDVVNISFGIFFELFSLNDRYKWTPQVRQGS